MPRCQSETLRCSNGRLIVGLFKLSTKGQRVLHIGGRLKKAPELLANEKGP
jgi:hypothetical protein